MRYIGKTKSAMDDKVWIPVFMISQIEVDNLIALLDKAKVYLPNIDLMTKHRISQMRRTLNFYRISKTCPEHREIKVNFETTPNLTIKSEND